MPRFISLCERFGNTPLQINAKALQKNSDAPRHRSFKLWFKSDRGLQIFAQIKACEPYVLSFNGVGHCKLAGVKILHKGVETA